MPTCDRCARARAFGCACVRTVRRVYFAGMRTRVWLRRRLFATTCSEKRGCSFRLTGARALACALARVLVRVCARQVPFAGVRTRLRRTRLRRWLFGHASSLEICFCSLAGDTLAGWGSGCLVFRLHVAFHRKPCGLHQLVDLSVARVVVGGVQCCSWIFLQACSGLAAQTSLPSE